MKTWTRKHGSQRASAAKKVTVLEPGAITATGDGHEPILWFRVGDVWTAIEFENEGEVRVLASAAAYIYRSVAK